MNEATVKVLDYYREHHSLLGMPDHMLFGVEWDVLEQTFGATLPSAEDWNSTALKGGFMGRAYVYNEHELFVSQRPRQYEPGYRYTPPKPVKELTIREQVEETLGYRVPDWVWQAWVYQYESWGGGNGTVTRQLEGK